MRRGREREKYLEIRTGIYQRLFDPPIKFIVLRKGKTSLFSFSPNKQQKPKTRQRDKIKTTKLNARQNRYTEKR
jgi:hypothetical protein